LPEQVADLPLLTGDLDARNMRKDRAKDFEAQQLRK
jgi:hypothetical protein